jgi:hypothetical protein
MAIGVEQESAKERSIRLRRTSRRSSNLFACVRAKSLNFIDLLLGTHIQLLDIPGGKRAQLIDPTTKKEKGLD